jgi:hypothetical protein
MATEVILPINMLDSLFRLAWDFVPGRSVCHKA